MTKVQVLEQVEVAVREAKVRNPIKRYELAKTLIAQAWEAQGFVTSPMQVAHAAGVMKSKTAR
jgi:hypothetical protein